MTERDPEHRTSITLHDDLWAEVTAALATHIRQLPHGAKVSRRDACQALRRIDAAFCPDEPVPLDDLLAAGADE